MTILLALWAFIQREWKPLAVTALVGAFALYWHHSGYLSGKAVAAKELTAARAQVSAAQSRAEASDRQSVHWSQSYAALKSTLDANDAALKAQEAAGAAQLAKVQKDAAKHAKALTDALARQRAAYKGDSCAVQTMPEGVQ